MPDSLFEISKLRIGKGVILIFDRMRGHSVQSSWECQQNLVTNALATHGRRTEL